MMKLSAISVLVFSVLACDSQNHTICDQNRTRNVTVPTILTNVPTSTQDVAICTETHTTTIKKRGCYKTKTKYSTLTETETIIEMQPITLTATLTSIETFTETLTATETLTEQTFLTITEILPCTSTRDREITIPEITPTETPCWECVPTSEATRDITITETVEVLPTETPCPEEITEATRDITIVEPTETPCPETPTPTSEATRDITIVEPTETTPCPEETVTDIPSGYNMTETVIETATTTTEIATEIETATTTTEITTETIITEIPTLLRRWFIRK